MMAEISLVIFTLCQQLAIGTFILTGMLLVCSNFSQAGSTVISKRLFFVLLLACIGLVASTLHLGSPMKGAHAFSRVGQAWLSNEVLAGVLFLATGGLFWLLSVMRSHMVGIRKLLLIASMVVAVCLMVAMIFTYMIPTVPSWYNVFTPLSFVLSALTCGALVSLLLMSNTSFETPCTTRFLNGLGLTALFASALTLGLQTSYWSGVESSITNAVEQVPHFSFYLKARIILSLLACILWILTLTKQKSSTTALFCVLLLVFLAEACGRILFYAVHMTVGL